MIRSSWSVFAFQNVKMLVNSILSFFLLFFLPHSTSACYWDPEVALQRNLSLNSICAIKGQDYSAFAPKHIGDLVFHA